MEGSAAIEVVVVGEPQDLRTKAVLSAFEDRPDFRVTRLQEIPAPQSPAETHPVFFAFVDSLQHRDRLKAVHAIAQVGGWVILLLSDASPAMRAVAFTAGASDVLYPPFDPQRIEAAAIRVLGLSQQRGAACPGELPVTVETPDPESGAGVGAGTLTTLSRNGFTAAFPSPPADPGKVVRVTLTLPAPTSLGTVFARVVSSEPSPTGVELSVSFAGLNPAESAAVAEALHRLGGDALDPLSALESLAALDRDQLRELLDGQVAGIRVPAMTAYERAGLSAPKGSPAAAFASVALARARAMMMAQVLLKAAQAGGLPRISQLHAGWDAELETARQTLREEIVRRMASRQEAAVRELKQVLAKLDAAADQVERVIGEATSEVSRARLQEVSGAPVRFERAPEPAAPSAPAARPARAPSSRRWARLSGLAAALAMGTVGLMAFHVESSARRAVDPATVIELPVVDRRIGQIGVRSVYDDPKWSVRYVVVDAGWYKSSDQEHLQAIWQLMRDLKLPKDWRLGIKDLDGRFLTDCQWPKSTPTPLGPPAAPAPRPSSGSR